MLGRPTLRQRNLQTTYQKLIDDEVHRPHRAVSLAGYPPVACQVTNLVESFVGIVKSAQVGPNRCFPKSPLEYPKLWHAQRSTRRASTLTLGGKAPQRAITSGARSSPTNWCLPPTPTYAPRAPPHRLPDPRDGGRPGSKCRGNAVDRQFDSAAHTTARRSDAEQSGEGPRRCIKKEARCRGGGAAIVGAGCRCRSSGH